MRGRFGPILRDLRVFMIRESVVVRSVEIWVRAQLFVGIGLLPFLILGCATVSPGGNRGQFELEWVSLNRAANTPGVAYRFDPVTQEVLLSGTGWEIELLLGSDRARVGSSMVGLEAPVRIEGGEVYVPSTFYWIQVDPRIDRARSEARKISEKAHAYKPTPPSKKPYESMAVRPRSRPSIKSTVPDRSGLLVVLDPGHGGKDPGCSYGGYQEKNLALDLAQRTRRYLEERGVKVVLTRDRDRFISLARRTAIAREVNATVLVSVHVNAVDNPSVSGVETFYKSQRLRSGDRQRVMRSLSLARSVQSSLARFVSSRDRGVKVNQRNLYVLRNATVPSILVEVGFLSNAQERARLVDSGYRDELARTLSNAISQEVVEYR